MFNIYPKVERAKNKATKEAMIWEEEEKLKLQELKKEKEDRKKSFLLPLISSLVNHPGFKYNGKISVASDDVFNTIIDKAENYAKLNGYDLEYTGKGAFNIVSICNDTGVQFKLIDNYGCETLCTVFYNTDTKEYKIISGGFMYMKVYKGQRFGQL